MKKLLLFMLLLLISSYSMAASVQIDRHGATTNIQSVNNIQMYQGGGRLDQINLKSQSILFPSTQSLAVGWRLSSDQDINFTLSIRTFDHINSLYGQLSVNPLDWGVSILTADRETIWSGSGLNFNLNMTLKAGQDAIVQVTGLTTAIYQSIFKDKLKPLDSFKTQLWTSNHVVIEPPAEIPLPAAVWLFGTALLGGLAIRRKHKANLEAKLA